MSSPKSDQNINAPSTTAKISILSRKLPTAPARAGIPASNSCFCMTPARADGANCITRPVTDCHIGSNTRSLNGISSGLRFACLRRIASACACGDFAFSSSSEPNLKRSLTLTFGSLPFFITIEASNAAMRRVIRRAKPILNIRRYRLPRRLRRPGRNPQAA